jgi:hypothetical protein
VYSYIYTRQVTEITKNNPLLLSIQEATILLSVLQTHTVSDSYSVHHQEFFTVHTAMVWVIQVLLTACEQEHMLLLAQAWEMCVDIERVFHFARKIVPKYFSLKCLASCIQGAGFYVRPPFTFARL